MNDILASHVRLVEDFPKPGIQFRDLTPMLADGAAFAACTQALLAAAGDFDLVAGVEARGFLFGASLAQASGKGLVLIRKPGKLPGQVLGLDYALEYGADRLEIHADQVPAGARILLLDDVLATGGTATAAARLLQQAGAVVTKALFVIALDGLDGEARLQALDVPSHALLRYPA